MTLKNKLILLFSLLILVVTGSITAYSTLEQRKNFIENELNFQKQTVELLSNTISLQYYNYLYQQLFAILHVKKNLNDKVQLFDHMIELERHNIKNVQEALEKLQTQQNLFANVNADLIALYQNKIILKPTHLKILQAKTVEGRTISDLLKSTFAHNILYSALFTDEKQYIAISFKSDAKSDFTYAFITDVTSLTKYYNSSNHDIINNLQEIFIKLNRTWKGHSLIVDGNTGKIILDSQKTIDDTANQNEKLNFDLATLKKVSNRETVRIQDDKNYIYTAYFKPLNWYVVTIRDQTETIKQSHKNMLIMLLMGFIILGCAIGSAILFTNKITKKLNQLTSTARKISISDLSDKKVLSDMAKSLESKGKDEVAVLANTLATMSESLNNKIDELITSNAKQNKLEGELNAAAEIQMGMLSKNEELPHTDKIDCFAFLDPAKEVGGDLYDSFFIDDEHLVICIGDVSDKGVPAALFMSTTLTLERLSLNLNQDPHQAISLINNKLSEHNPNLMFVTLFIGILNIHTGKFTYSNAGHCQPIIVKQDGTTRNLTDLSGPAVGVMENLDYELSSTTINDGEFILLYTDGVSEAQNEAQELYGERRILDYCHQISSFKCKDIVEGLVHEVEIFRGKAKQSDDITILCVQKI